MADISSIKAQALAAITAESAQLTAHWQARDGEGITSHFAETAMAMEPEVTASGLAAIKAYVARALGDPGFSLNMETDLVDASASGDLGYARGRFRLTFTNPATGEPQVLSGHYVAIFKQQDDGAWKIVEDISTINSFDH